MKKAGITLAVMLCNATVFGQYAGPPARDIRDAVRMLQEVQRAIEPAITAVRDQAAVLDMLTRAANQLKESQPATSFDDAEKVIDEYLRRRGESDPGIPRDLERTIASARQILEQHKPILAVRQAREHLHHDVIHPLQRDAMRNAAELQGLAAQLQFMQTRMWNQVLPEILSATGFASTDPK